MDGYSSRNAETEPMNAELARDLMIGSRSRCGKRQVEVEHVGLNATLLQEKECLLGGVTKCRQCLLSVVNKRGTNEPGNISSS